MASEFHYTAKQVEALRRAYLSLLEQALADGESGKGPDADRPAHEAWLKWRAAAISYDAQNKAKRKGI